MRLAIVVFFSFLELSVFSQAKNISFEKLTVGDGLPSDVVNCIFQDKKGFLWIGTKEGVCMYDGYQVTLIDLPPDIYKDVQRRRIDRICQDRDNNIWIATFHGIVRYNLEKENRQHYLPDEENTFIQSRFVNDITVGPDGIVWAGTRNGVFFYNRQQDKFECYTGLAHHQKYSNEEKGERIIMRLYFDHLGYMWIGTQGNGVTMLNPNDNSKQLFRNVPDDESTIGSNFIEDIFEDHYGVMWFGSSNGLSRFSRETGTFLNYNKFGASEDCTDPSVNSIAEDKEGDLFIGTNNGLEVFDRKEGRFHHYFSHPLLKNTLSSNNILSVYFDKSGKVWIGTIHGLNSYCPYNSAFEYFSKIPDNPSSLIDNTLRTFTADRDGFLWIGTKKDGVDRFDFRSHTFKHYKLPQGHPGARLYNTIRTSFLDSKGQVLFGTDGGLLIYNKPTDEVLPYDFDGMTHFSKGIFAISQDKQGGYWFAEIDRGLLYLDLKKRMIKEVLITGGQNQEDLYGNIKVLRFDAGGNLWMSLYMKGLACYNPETDETRLYRDSDETGKGPACNQIWDIYESKAGKIWLATSVGLNEFDPSAGTFRLIDQTSGLPGDFVLSILEDYEGKLWLGTNKGLCSYNPKNGNVVSYTQANGLQGEIYEYQVRAKFGNLMFFGGNNGFNIFNPSEFIANPYIPVPAFTKVRIDGQPVHAGYRAEQKLVSRVSIPYTNEIILKKTIKDVKIDFSALSYIEAFRNRYQYRILRADTTWSWVEAGKRSIDLSLPHAGRYLLQLRASNCDGIWNLKPIEMEIKVVSDLLVYGILILISANAAAVYFYLARKRYLLKKQSKPADKYYKKDPRDISGQGGIKKEAGEKDQKILDALMVSMNKEKLYLNKRISKRYLAAHLRISDTMLAGLLKEYTNMNFNDFINRYRIEAVKKLLEDSRYKDYTLLAIAEECGFNSKTSFYRVFKDFTGLTPAEYIEKIKEQQENKYPR